MCKAYSIEVALRSIDHAVQVHGAMGFTNEVHLAESVAADAQDAWPTGPPR
jgi:alkylation response protein AidB-like acyl-CoA dehydrogenase